MTETKEAIRKQLYDYINVNVAQMTKAQAGEIKKLLLAHDAAESKKDIQNGQRLLLVKQKIAGYLTKAEQLPLLTIKLQAEIATLKVVSSWINSGTQ